MQKTEIIEAIHSVLANDLNIANLAAFHPYAKLNEDLYLDSVLVLQLLINLELKLSIEVPDDALHFEDFETVDSLSQFLLNKLQQQTTDNTDNDTAPVEEEFEDIKVHCFVSCLCECIKADERVDHRPFYFGVWDADVVVNSEYAIHYHAEDLNHDFFRKWYQKLYGVYVKPWYNDTRTKEQNISTLLSLLEQKTTTQNMMVMLDMYRLPERENKFNQNPFPHYVMLENTDDPETMFMFDPDFRWEGEQNKQQVLNAIASDAVAGGYIFDGSEIQPSTNQAIYDYFITCFNAENNPMTTAIRTIINAHMDTRNSLSPAHLTQALTQLPVLAIRKYAYEHGLAFFMRELSLNFDDFETWCDVIEVLVSTYKKIQFRAMKIASITSHSSAEKANNAAHENNTQLVQELTAEITQLLDEQDQREFDIKHHIYQLFQQWRQHISLTENSLQQEAQV